MPFHRTASGQSGAVAHDQVLASGLNQRQIERRLRTGELVQLHRAVYRVAGAPETALQKLWAAVLAAHPVGVASRRSAACLWELRNIRPPKLPEITVPHDWANQLDGVVVHRSDHLQPPDIVQRSDGLPLTSPARTLFDIGVQVGPLAAESACVDALHRGLVSYKKLVDVYARVGGKGRPGSAAMRLFLQGSPEGVAAIESELEVRFWRLIRECGLPLPTPQFWVVTDGGNFRLDFAWPELKAGVELNGKAEHAGPLAKKRDRRRANFLKGAGWTILEYGWGDIVGAPVAVAEQLIANFGDLTALSVG